MKYQNDMSINEILNIPHSNEVHSVPFLLSAFAD